MPILDKTQLVGTCKKLPFEVDFSHIAREIHTIPDRYWETNRANVHRDAQAVFVRGRPAREMVPDHNQPVLEILPNIKKIIYEFFPGTPGKCLIARLKPRGIVHPHEDRRTPDDTNYPDEIRLYFLSTLRIHIPIETNPKVLFFCNGEFFHLAPGGAWVINNHDLHAVINQDLKLSRTHLIVDIYPNEQLLQMLKDIPRTQGIVNQPLFEKIRAATPSLMSE